MDIGFDDDLCDPGQDETVMLSYGTLVMLSCGTQTHDLCPDDAVAISEADASAQEGSTHSVDLSSEIWPGDMLTQYHPSSGQAAEIISHKVYQQRLQATERAVPA